MMQSYWYGGDWVGHSFFGGFMMIVFWAVIVMGVVWAIRSFHSHDHKYEGKTALDHLNERYAKGELTKEQFESMKRDITK